MKTTPDYVPIGQPCKEMVYTKRAWATKQDVYYVPYYKKRNVFLDVAILFVAFVGICFAMIGIGLIRLASK